MADYKRGFYLQEDFWLAVRECSAKVQNEVMGAIARLYFEGVDSSDSLKGTAKSVYIALRERVSAARSKSLAGSCAKVQKGNRKGEQKGNQTGEQKGEQNAVSLLKSESESKGEITTYSPIPLAALPTQDEPAAWVDFVAKAIEVYTAVTGRPCLMPSHDVTYKLRRIFDVGYGLDDIELVCRFKQSEWQGTERQQFLTPQTLFGPKFEGYLNAAKADPKRGEREDAEQFSAAI